MTTDTKAAADAAPAPSAPPSDPAAIADAAAPDLPTPPPPRRVLTLEDIKRQAERRFVEPLDLPELGGTVFVRLVPVGEAMEFGELVAGLEKGRQAQSLVWTAVYALANEDGSAMFPDPTQGYEICRHLQPTACKAISDKTGEMRKAYEAGFRKDSGGPEPASSPAA